MASSSEWKVNGSFYRKGKWTFCLVDFGEKEIVFFCHDIDVADRRELEEAYSYAVVIWRDEVDL